MSDAVRFNFDPLCPWCYQTSRWARHVERLGEVELSWGFFSLELHGFTKPPEMFDPGRTRAGLALRTAWLVREELGEQACGTFYAALGKRYFVGLEDLRDRAVVQDALADIGIDAAIASRAVTDPATWEGVRADHDLLVAEVQAFGVPTIRLDAGRGPAIFGPVISEPPDGDDDAVELWRHVSWLARNQTFYELKRTRPIGPDLPYWRRFIAERASAAASGVR